MTPVQAPYCCRCCGAPDFEVVAKGIRDWEYGVEGTWHHYRCVACGIVQIDPFPTLDELVRAYDIDYHGYTASSSKGGIYSLLYAVNDTLLRRSLVALAPQPARVLDVGCGAGEFLATLRRLRYSSLTGIDFNARAVALARAKGIEAHQGLFLDFRAPEGSYDMIVMNNYLEHTVDPVAEVKYAKRLLSPNGVLFGEIPNYRSFDRILFGRYWGGNHAPRHTFHFTPRTLVKLLESCGLHQVRTMQQINTGHIALSVQNLLQRNRADLRNNPAVVHGRSSYYPALLLGFVPLNAVFAALGLSGIMKFSARA